jgi:hypothetical protein
MTAQIINFTEKRDAIHLRRNQVSAAGFLWPGIIFGSAMFWICVGVGVAKAWPLIAHGIPPAHG